MSLASKLDRFRQFGLPSLSYLQGSFSQFGEDFFLRGEFSEVSDGFYVDVGGFHPFQLSNFHYLRSKGWTGINIEPQPAQFALFEKHCPNEINLNLALSSEEGEFRFLVDGVVSRLLEEDEETDSPVIKVPVRRLDDVLVEHVPEGRKIDVLSVDCEGHDIQVMQSNDWSKYRPTIILAEDHSAVLGSDVDTFMESIDYELTSWCLLTKIYRDKNSPTPDWILNVG